MSSHFKHLIKKPCFLTNIKKWRSPANWEAYHKQRNLTTNIKRNSVRTYFDERCAGGPKSKDFWPTVKPFLSNKEHLKTQLSFSEDNIIISDQTSVSNVINDFYVNVAKDIGTDHSPCDITTYPSLTRFNKIATQGAPQMAVDKEANSLSRVYSYYSSLTCAYSMYSPP